MVVERGRGAGLTAAAGFSGPSLRQLPSSLVRDVLKSGEELLSGVIPDGFLEETRAEWSTKRRRFPNVLYLSPSCAKVANHEGE